MSSAPAPVPVKIPVKIPVGIVPGKLVVKLPPGVPLPTNIPRPAVAAVVAKTVVAAAAGAPKPIVVSAPKPVVAPKPAVVAPAKQAPVKRPKIEDDEEEDERLLLGATKASIVVKKEVKKEVKSQSSSPPPRKVARIELPKPSLNEDDVSDEEDLSLFARASRNGLLSQEPVDDEPDVAEVGPPPRPPIRRFPGNVEAAIEKAKVQLNREENNARIKDENKSVSLGTSKINYIDPRIVCSWATREKVPLSKLFSATLQKKFPWAMTVTDSYRF